jgi:hypothetical protein
MIPLIHYSRLFVMAFKMLQRVNFSEMVVLQQYCCNRRCRQIAMELNRSGFSGTFHRFYARFGCHSLSIPFWCHYISKLVMANISTSLNQPDGHGGSNMSNQSRNPNLVRTENVSSCPTGGLPNWYSIRIHRTGTWTYRTSPSIALQPLSIGTPTTMHPH